MQVPEILISGNHEKIKLWRKLKMLERTLDRKRDSKTFLEINKTSIKNVLSRSMIERLIEFEDYQNHFYPDW